METEYRDIFRAAEDPAGPERNLGFGGRVNPRCLSSLLIPDSTSQFPVGLSTAESIFPSILPICPSIRVAAKFIYGKKAKTFFPPVNNARLETRHRPYQRTPKGEGCKRNVAVRNLSAETKFSGMNRLSNGRRVQLDGHATRTLP